jgi:peptidoglycan/LPS O-acetylase OafA/YrhL
VAFLAAAPIALGGSAIASIWNAGGNADGHRRFAKVLGLTSGAMAIGMGATVAAKPDLARGVGVASAVLGGVSVALATRAIRRHNADLTRAREVERARATVETSVAPIVPAGPHAGAGVAVSLRF